MRFTTFILAILLFLASLLPASAADSTCPLCTHQLAGTLLLPYRWTSEEVVALQWNPQSNSWSARLDKGLVVSVSQWQAVGDLNGDDIDDRAFFLESSPAHTSPYAGGTRWDLLVLVGGPGGTERAAAGITLSLSLTPTKIAIENGQVQADLAAGDEIIQAAFVLASDGLRRADGGLVSLTHLVHRGETLSQIAARYRVSLADLMARNGMGDSNQLNNGQSLSIPPTQPIPDMIGGVPFLFFGLPGQQLRMGETPLPLRPAQHVVQPGERWDQIAGQHRVALPDLIDYNGLRLSTPPKPGHVVFIPGIPRDKVIYLTFDDGPHEEWTPQFLDLLSRFEAQATFFIIGRYAQLYPDLIQREIEDGHGLANHSYYHYRMDKLNAEQILWELNSTQTAIGVDNQAPCFRPPYGILPPAATDTVVRQGYEVVTWDIDSLDWKKTDPDAVAATVIERAYDGAIVLMHDGGADDRSVSLAALETVLTELGAQGFRFEPYCGR